MCLVAQSCLTLSGPMDYARQALLSMGFSRQEYWGGLPRPPPGDLPNPEIEPRSPTLQADSLLSEPPGKPMNSGVRCQPSSRGLPDPGIKPVPHAPPASAGRLFTTSATWEAPAVKHLHLNV